MIKSIFLGGMFFLSSSFSEVSPNQNPNFAPGLNAYCSLTESNSSIESIDLEQIKKMGALLIKAFDLDFEKIKTLMARVGQIKELLKQSPESLELKRIVLIQRQLEQRIKLLDKHRQSFAQSLKKYPRLIKYATRKGNTDLAEHLSNQMYEICKQEAEFEGELASFIMDTDLLVAAMM